MTQELATEIAAAEQHLKTLRARRDALIVRRFEAGESKYRLAKDWNLSENTITRIVTGVKPGRKRSAESQRELREQERSPEAGEPV